MWLRWIGRVLPSDAPPEQLRRTLDLRLVPCALVAWAGALICARLSPTSGYAISAAALATATAVVTLYRYGRGHARQPVRPERALHRYRGRRALLLSAGLPCCVLALVALTTAETITANRAGPIGAAIVREAAITAQLRITSDPDLSPTPDRFTGADRYLIDARISVATASGKRFEADTPVLVLAGPAWSGLRLGEIVTAGGKLIEPEAGADVSALFVAATAPSLKFEAVRWQRWTSALRADFRHHCSALAADAAGLLPGMVLGDRSALEPDVENAMKRTGLTHLTAVSGANCSILVGFVLIGAYALKFPRWTAAAMSLCALGAFVLLVRPDPSVLRAALMGTIGIIAVLSGRGRRSAALLSSTVVVLLVVDPWLATDYAFILSVLATTGLIVFGHSCARWFSRWLPWWLAQALAVPIAAQVFCAPIILLLQPKLSTYSIVANVLAAPVIAPITILGMFGVLAVAVFPPAAVPLIGIAGAAAGWVAGVARFLAAAPGAALSWPPGAFGAVLLAAVGLSALGLLRALAGSTSTERTLTDPPAAASASAVSISAVSKSRRPGPGTGRRTVRAFRAGKSRAVRFRRRRAVRWYLAATTIGLLLGLGPALWWAGKTVHAGRDWTVVACDVGQGDAFVLHTGLQSAIVVDTGPDPQSVDSCLRSLDIETIDLLVLTHMHLDHSGGLTGVLGERTVHRVLVSTAEERLPRPVQRIFDDYGITAERAAAGQGGTLGTVRWDVLWPTADFAAANENDVSVVLSVEIATAGGMTVLFTGDLEEAGLAGILEASALASALASSSETDSGRLEEYRRHGVDLLKIAHHGAENGGTTMIEQFDPAIALISVGGDNDYGHPHDRILQSLLNSGTTIGRTDRDGQIYVDKEGDTLLMWSTR